MRDAARSVPSGSSMTRRTSALHRLLIDYSVIRPMLHGLGLERGVAQVTLDQQGARTLSSKGGPYESSDAPLPALGRARLQEGFMRFVEPRLSLKLASMVFTVFVTSQVHAGKQQPGAIPGEVAEAMPDASARFKCEKRPFDRSAGLYCYGPAAMRAAYGVQGLLDAGFNGKGRTIVILDAFGSPFIASDLKLFDSVFGLPDPPSFTQISMPGTPAYDPTNGDVVGWTGEIALDVEWAHAMAPGANIVLVAAKSDYDDDLIDGLNYALDNHLGDVVSMSFGESELYLANPDGLDIVAHWQAAFAKARRQHVTLMVSSGDQGSDTQGFGTLNTGWPATSPLVTAIGGTNLQFGTATNADPNGSYRGEEVWNDGYGATGGGMSILMAEPDYQTYNLPPSVNSKLHGYRGVPDLSYNAGVVGGVIAAWAAPYGPGVFFIFGGTSAGAPQWSGIIADINQARGRKLGFINKRLYQLGAAGTLQSLLHDITVGDNAFGGVPGYPAGPGPDLSTGWGTPNFGQLGTMLADPTESE
jgi:subtilase family serine protease